MDRIAQLDQQLTQTLRSIPDIAAELEMPFICLLSDESEIEKQNYPGLYRIDVQTAGAETELAAWVAEFRLAWGQHAVSEYAYAPSFKQKRISKHTELLEWMPLYLGKSKNIGKRVLEHIHLSLHKRTYALKLKARPAMAARVFRLHCAKVDVHNYDVIVTELERALRNRWHPLIGKQ